MITLGSHFINILWYNVKYEQVISHLPSLCTCISLYKSHEILIKIIFKQGWLYVITESHLFLNVYTRTACWVKKHFHVECHGEGVANVHLAYNVFTNYINLEAEECSPWRKCKLHENNVLTTCYEQYMLDRTSHFHSRVNWK
jgi:hypothetical protein